MTNVRFSNTGHSHIIIIGSHRARHIVGGPLAVSYRQFNDGAYDGYDNNDTRSRSVDAPRPCRLRIRNTGEPFRVVPDTFGRGGAALGENCVWNLQDLEFPPKRNVRGSMSRMRFLALRNTKRGGFRWTLTIGVVRGLHLHPSDFFLKKKIKNKKW